MAVEPAGALTLPDALGHALGGEVDMAYALDAFCRDCAANLRADPGRGGKEKIRKDLERLLVEKAFVADHCGPDAEQGVHVLYRDPELGFCVLAHVNCEPRTSPPHDHGNSWAIYGQATAYTDMTEYRRLDGASGPGGAKLEVSRRYRLEPGHAGLYDVGAIHSIAYGDNARFVRVTGADLEHVPRLKFDLEKQTAVLVESATMQRTSA
jgi:predicted metal-dependent enzyme (double-stranded beta helix superfamily)